jgi:hypothetical protein
MTDPQNSSAESVLAAALESQRDSRDAVLTAALDLLCERTGQNKYRFAASVIRGTKLGRHAIDDRAALRRIMATPADRRREVAGKEARQIAATSGERPDSIARRLRRKLRENETDEMVISASSICDKGQ